MLPGKKLLNSFKLHETLNPDVWDKSNSDYIMQDDIREQLLEIASEFISFLDVPTFVSDITLTGSLANYNWSSYSDFDLHLLIDFKQFDEEAIEIYQKFFSLKKFIFNKNYNINIKNYVVEIYPQDDTEPHESSGIFSILYNKWITKPKREHPKINKNELKTIANHWITDINTLISICSDKNLEDSKELLKNYKDKIKKYRQRGLETSGEFSTENLVYKILRRGGYIDKIYDFEYKIIGKNLSLPNNKDSVMK